MVKHCVTKFLEEKIAIKQVIRERSGEESFVGLGCLKIYSKDMPTNHKMRAKD